MNKWNQYYKDYVLSELASIPKAAKVSNIENEHFTICGFHDTGNRSEVAQIQDAKAFGCEDYELNRRLALAYVRKWRRERS